MKRLILMRHAKSSWAVAGQPDHDRPLNPRGRRAAGLIGDWLRTRGYLPDLALVSDAARAQQSWTYLAEALGHPPMTPLPQLYHASPDAMLDLLRAADPAQCVLMIGHQPGIGALAHTLLRDTPAGADPARYPTAATSVIDFAVHSWRDAGPRTGTLADFAVPRALE